PYCAKPGSQLQMDAQQGRLVVRQFRSLRREPDAEDMSFGEEKPGAARGDSAVEGQVARIFRLHLVRLISTDEACFLEETDHVEILGNPFLADRFWTIE